MTRVPKAIPRAKPIERLQSRDAAESSIPRAAIAHQVGGHLALDFCNTAGEHLAERPQELLVSWESFLRWATQVGLIGTESYFELLTGPEPLDAILQLREAIYRVALAITRAGQLSKRDVDCIRERANATRPEVVFRRNGAQWRPLPAQSSEQLCGILAAEALSLFCSPNVARIGICEGGDCGWLFLDDSRGKRRRWCDMNDCGSREKARRYYEKHKGS